MADIRRACWEAVPVVIVAIVCAIVAVIWLKIAIVFFGGQ